MTRLLRPDLEAQAKLLRVRGTELRKARGEIARLSAQLRSHIGEDVVSSDFGVKSPRTWDPFDSATIDDAKHLQSPSQLQHRGIKASYDESE